MQVFSKWVTGVSRVLEHILRISGLMMSIPGDLDGSRACRASNTSDSSMVIWWS